MYKDTIAAISTPMGEGGIGIVRLSGPEAAMILRQVFRRSTKKGALEPYRLCYGHVVEPASGDVVDEALAVFMPSPHTYTREDVVEINCHGGIVPLRRTLELVLRLGARLANPGEFTLRAFLNGRLSLDQAEAVLDIVQAKTQVGLRLAMEQLGGRLSAQVRPIRQEIMGVLAYLTASIDFAEDEIPEQDIEAPVKNARAALQQLIANADAGIIYRQGLRTAIVGAPNVGKSSLLNALLRTSRAIVTPIPGTTRDTLEETLNLRGIPLCLVDTAGIVQTDELVEKLGVERSRLAIDQADLILLVVDGNRPPAQADREIAALIGNRPAILVINKSDLFPAPSPPEVGDLLPDRPTVSISALTGQGLVALEEAIESLIFSGKAIASDALAVTSARHKEALQRAEERLAAAETSIQQGLPADFVSIDLTAALNSLGEITGETVTEELLETIFSRFCVGK
ncbi:MAG: tRNA uridine-5-carboxymethylaminomethyl(34) synthesis GTPase MnmE [Chloroflexota bacterium]